MVKVSVTLAKAGKIAVQSGFVNPAMVATAKIAQNYFSSIAADHGCVLVAFELDYPKLNKGYVL